MKLLSLIAAAVFLLAAAPVGAATNLLIRLDSGGSHGGANSLHVKDGDARTVDVATSSGDSPGWTAIDSWDDAPPTERPLHEFHLEVAAADRAVNRAKLIVDIRQAIQLFRHEPGTLRPVAANERGSIYVTLYASSGGHSAEKVRERYGAAPRKRCPELLAAISYSGKQPDFQPVLQSELRPAAKPADERRDVLYGSIELARCVRLVGDKDARPSMDRPAVVRPYADWMTKNLPLLRNKTLAEIALPGTHDSGAYQLSDHKSPERSTAEWVAGLSMNITKPWAITQRLDIRGQLDGGIRWLDMRTAFDGDEFYFHHALLGPKTRDMLRQIRGFIDAPEHEHELIVLEFCNWQGFDGDSASKLWRRLGDMILAELGEENIYRKGASGAAKSEAELMKTRLGDVLTGNKSRVVVTFQGHTSEAPFAFDAYETFGGSYANRHLWPEVEKDQRAKLAAHRPGRLFVLSWTVTANQETISTDLENRSHPENPAFNLEYLTRGGQGNEMRQIANWQGHEKISVVICDFFDSSPLVPLCFDLNGIRR